MSVVEAIPTQLSPVVLGELLGTETLFLLSSVFDPVNSLWASSISANSWSWNWYMALTPFEAVFLNFIMLEIFFLRYIEVLPININNLFYGDPSGKRRRKRTAAAGTNVSNCEINEGAPETKIMESVFSVLRKLDQQECMLRTLCLLEKDSTSMSLSRPLKVPAVIRRILSFIKRIAIESPSTSTTVEEEEATSSRCPTITTEFDKTMLRYQNAIRVGSTSRTRATTTVPSAMNRNSTVDRCAATFDLCPIESADIELYLQKIYLQ